MKYDMAYSEPLLCLKDDTLDRYEMLAVALTKKKHMRADTIEEKYVNTNLDFLCSRSELWFGAVPMPQVYDLRFLLQC
jgi:hypothetical protein